MNKHGALLVLVLGVSIILTACGGAAPAGAAAANPAPTATSIPAPTPTTAAPSVALNATLSDAGIAPKDFAAPVGAQVTFTVNNTRTDERDCIFRDLTTIKLYPGQSTWSLDQIAAGTTKTLAFAAPAKPATYQIDCGLVGYSGQPRQPVPNMVATLVVK